MKNTFDAPFVLATRPETMTAFKVQVKNSKHLRVPLENKAAEVNTAMNNQNDGWEWWIFKKRSQLNRKRRLSKEKPGVLRPPALPEPRTVSPR